MSQNHFTVSFPVRSPSDAKALTEQLPALMPELFRANDTIGTVHYSRFTLLSEKTLLFLGDFDGEFAKLMADLARAAGPVFDVIFQHVDNPPPTPVAAKFRCFGQMDEGASSRGGESLHGLSRGDRQEDQGASVCRGRRRSRRTASVSGDPAHQVIPSFHRGTINLARARQRDHERPG